MSLAARSPRNRQLSERLVDQIEGVLGKKGPKWTADAVFPGGDFPVDGFKTMLLECIDRYAFLDPLVVERLARLYGTDIHRLFEGKRSIADLGRYYGAGLYDAEIDFLVAHEWAQTAEDILFRRTKLGLAHDTGSDRGRREAAAPLSACFPGERDARLSAVRQKGETTKMPGHILVIDQGTTSSRAIVYDSRLRPLASAQQEFTQHYPAPGWVEHDPEEIWESVVNCCRNALEKAGLDAGDIAGIGITNQRETTLIWDRETGKPLGRAIVWQDRRTAAQCEALRKQGLEDMVRERTGMLLDPYFAGTKLAWLLDNIPGARERAEAGRVAFGTIDSFLICRLTGGARHVTDATNASRTLLFDIRKGTWDEGLCETLSVPMSVLPEVLDCAAEFGTSDPAILGAAIPILGVAGDQQAAVIGQGCFTPGMVKSTYGTGCFALINTGDRFVLSENRLLTTIAYQLNGKITYALEGSIFMAGAVVQWLRDELRIIEAACEVGDLAANSDPELGIYMVPAFVGLGAPWWDADARGAIFGMTRNTGRAEFARAALEAVCYQTWDLIHAMHKDWGAEGDRTILRVDGGMTASDWTMQRLADILGAPIERPANLETTALGAAWLVGLQAGFWGEGDAAATDTGPTTRFEPTWEPDTRRRHIDGWRDAVRRTLVVDR